ncbi:MAG: hypothetical protein U0572_00500 [Phycisphaerales bacterium]
MRPFALSFVVLSGTCVVGAHAEAGITSTWIGPTVGNWSVGANWSSGVPGTGGVTDAVINGGRRATIVTLDAFPSIVGLTIGTNCTLTQPDNRDITLQSVANDGIWAVNSAGNGTDLLLNAPTVTFDGSGVVELGNNANNRIFSLNAARTLVNSAGHTIRGGGQLGLNNTVLDNEGLVSATQPAGLFLDLADNPASANNNLLSAVNGSTLTIYGTSLDNTNGTIRADDGSFVLFRFGWVSGGVLRTTGSGEIRTTTEQTQFIDLTLDGVLRQTDNADAQALGTINNLGTWRLDSTGNGTDLLLNSAVVTFAGPGTLELGNNANNRIFSLNAVRTLVNSAGHTIRGGGQLGLNNTVLDNEGLVSATQPAGLFLDLADNPASANNNLLSAVNGSTLTIYGTSLDNTNGTIRADDGSFVLFRFGWVSGGVLRTTGSGEIRTTTEQTQFIDLTLDGVLRQTDNADAQALGTINNLGTWRLDSTGNGTDLLLNSAVVTFAGPGTLELGNNANNRIFSLNAVRTLVNSAGHTIRGGGQLGLNNTVLDNEGLVSATQPAGLFLDLADNPASANNNLLSAVNGSTLTIYGTSLDNTNGTIRADDASFVLFRFGAVTGGVLRTTGSGEIRTTTEQTQFIDLTLDGVLRQTDNADAQALGTINNLGTWRLDSTGNGTDLLLNSAVVTFAGPGTLELGNNANNRIYSLNAVRTLVNSAGHTIRGGGQLGLNNTVIQNEGTIIADQSAGITIDPADGGDNHNGGAIHVTGNGSLLIANGAWVNRGLLDIQAERSATRSGSYTQTSGETRVDGTLNVSGGGTVNLTGGLLTGSGTVNGAVNVSGGSTSPSAADLSAVGTLNLHGTYTQSGTGGLVVDLGTDGNDLVAVTGVAHVGGALQVRLANGFVPVPGQSFTILTATGGVTGDFDCFKYPNGGAEFFHVLYHSNSIELVVDSVPTVPADLNFDGVVDAADLAILLGAWSSTPCDSAICCPADLDGDGVVGAMDLAILLGAWG